MRALNFDSILGKSPRSHISWYLDSLVWSRQVPQDPTKEHVKPGWQCLTLAYRDGIPVTGLL